MREENPTGCASCATALQANPSGGVTVLLVAAGAVGLWLLFRKKEEKPKPSLATITTPILRDPPLGPPRQTFTTAGYNPSFVIGAF